MNTICLRLTRGITLFYRDNKIKRLIVADWNNRSSAAESVIPMVTLIQARVMSGWPKRKATRATQDS